MSGRRSRDKSARAEKAVAKLIGARKVSRAYQAGHDLELKVGDRLLRIECKARADGLPRCADRESRSPDASRRYVAAACGGAD
jgi:hypothetical protein